MNDVETPDLAWYAETALRELEQELRGSALGLAGEVEPLAFRDAAGRHWAVTPGTGAWLRDDGGTWVSTPGPPAALEGPSVWSFLLKPRRGKAREERPERRPADAVEFLPRMAREVREAYERGEITAPQAEALLLGRAVLDERGVAWSVGCRSGRWYRFDGRAWVQVAQPPDPATLPEANRWRRACPACGRPSDAGSFCAGCGRELPPPPPEPPADVQASILAFLENGADTLAEPVTAAWAPPGSAGARCPACGGPVEPADAFCPACGSALGTTATPVASQAPVAQPAPVGQPAPVAQPAPAAAWTPTHIVPAGGAWAWAAPDASVAASHALDPGLQLRMLETVGAWAHVQGSNGWTGWVDGRTLLPPTVS